MSRFTTKVVITIVIAILIRVVPIIKLGQMQNILTQQLLLTDIDYKVYTDAAGYQSPYQRHTYRYSPLLAYLMEFNFDNQIFGKLIFVIFDVIAMISIVIFSRKDQTSLLYFYAYNPLFAYLTIRGSCQSINLALMYLSFGLIFNKNGNICLGDYQIMKSTQSKITDNNNLKYIGYLIYGFWVHFRAYPIILLPIILIHQYKLCKITNKSFFATFIKIGLISGGVFIALAAYFYNLYGYKFLQQTYFYHLSRLDNRHSFSAFFYDIYLSLNYQNYMRSIAQIILVFGVIVKTHKTISPYYAHFLMTVGFVNFNKVITMQYYMWVFGSLILLIPQSSLWTNSNRRFQISFGYLMQWLLPVLVWIWLSIKMQINGQNHFTFMWVVTILKLLSDVWVLSNFMNKIVNHLSYQLGNGQIVQNPIALALSRRKKK